MSIDEKSLNLISYGLYILGCKNSEGRLNACIVNSLIQVTAEPARLAVAVNKRSLTHEYIKQSGLFSASVLNNTATLPFIGPFGFRSGRDINKFEKVKYTLTPLGAPVVLENTSACYEVSVEREVDLGTHTMFIGTLTGAQMLCAGTCMTYDYYHRVIKGRTPKEAPHK